MNKTKYKILKAGLLVLIFLGTVCCSLMQPGSETPAAAPAAAEQDAQAQPTGEANLYELYGIDPDVEYDGQDLAEKIDTATFPLKGVVAGIDFPDLAADVDYLSLSASYNGFSIDGVSYWRGDLPAGTPVEVFLFSPDGRYCYLEGGTTIQGWPGAGWANCARIDFSEED